ncbi:unnamed protein product [Gadus morhua 'NCC']
MLNMGAVLLLLIGVADGVKTFCNATRPHITTQCFGSLGGTVEVLLPTKIYQDDFYKLKKENVPILSDRSQTTNIRYSFNIQREKCPWQVKGQRAAGSLAKALSTGLYAVRLGPGATLTAPYSTSLSPCPPGRPGDVNVQHIIIYCHGGQRDV